MKYTNPTTGKRIPDPSNKPDFAPSAGGSTQEHEKVIKDALILDKAIKAIKTNTRMVKEIRKLKDKINELTTKLAKVDTQALKEKTSTEVSVQRIKYSLTDKLLYTSLGFNLGFIIYYSV